MNLMVSTIRGVYIYWLCETASGWQWVSYADSRKHGPVFKSIKAALKFGLARGDVV